MSAKPPSSSATGNIGLFGRVRRALKGDPLSREELHDYIRQPETDLDAEEKSMLAGVLEVSETQFDDILAIIIESGHSRFPVIGEDRDEVLGVLLAKDLLRYFGSNEADDVPLLRILRPASVIPESKRLNALLKEFRDSHNHMAIVVDEYGGVAGLLTIEDVLEEIVGEIDDEHDQEEAEFIGADGEHNGRPCFAVRALTRVEDFNEFFGCGLDDEEYDTIGGLVMHELGRLPRRGEKIDFSGFEFLVVKADRRRVETLRVQRNG
jgi:magnesium and cobalt transporter